MQVKIGVDHNRQSAGKSEMTPQRLHAWPLLEKEGDDIVRTTTA